jgi:hypothetical protein
MFRNIGFRCAASCCVVHGVCCMWCMKYVVHGVCCMWYMGYVVMWYMKFVLCRYMV